MADGIRNEDERDLFWKDVREIEVRKRERKEKERNRNEKERKK